MTLISNTDPAQVNFAAVVGDAIDLELYITNNSLPFAMTSCRMMVRREDGLLLKDWISGVSPADIVIDAVNTGYIHIYDIDGFLESGYFDFDFEANNGTGVITVIQGIWKVDKQITYP